MLDSLGAGPRPFRGAGDRPDRRAAAHVAGAAAQFETVDGILHTANIPTEEVFTTPDPERVDGHVSSTKPLFVSGGLVTGLRVRFEGGRAVEIDADSGADTLRRWPRVMPGPRGSARWRSSTARAGSAQLGTIFYDTLLDENAACHIALGQGLRRLGRATTQDRERMNHAEIHVDFMIGADDVAVTGFTADGTEVPLLRGGEWQI